MPHRMPSPAPPERLIGLDLMRAVAIVLVLICHVYLMESAWAKTAVIWQVAVCGFIGVQLFFVLSGFLIGRILLRLIGAPHVAGAPGRTSKAGWRSWLTFMARRWMRTLPLYWLVLLLLAWFWPPSFWVPHNKLLLPHLLAYGSFTQNLFWPLPDGWFSVSWSLAVEEWFYLVFSAMLLGLAKLFRPGRALAIALLVFILTPLLLRIQSLGSVNWKPGDEQIVPLWFDALATGVLTSWILARVTIGTTARRVALASGLALVGFAWSGALGWLHVFAQSVSHSVNYELLSCGSAMCIPALLSLRTVPTLLGLVVRGLSKWSYCLYLTHLSILEIGGYYGPRWKLPPVWLATLCLVLTFLTAWVSWRFFESPILRLRPPEGAAAGPPSQSIVLVN